VGLGVARLLPQVVKLERDLVVWVKEAAIAQVSMLRNQNLQTTQMEKPAVTVLAHEGMNTRTAITVLFGLMR